MTTADLEKCISLKKESSLQNRYSSVKNPNLNPDCLTTTLIFSSEKSEEKQM